MKVMICDITLDAPGRATTLLLPDSAMTRVGQPVFLPDFASHWQGAVMPALRVSRLGLAVEKRFANRYFDAIAAVHRLIDPSHPASADAAYTGFDGALAPGVWIENCPEELTMTCGTQTRHVEAFRELACRAVEHVSRHITIRNGDIIALCSLAIAVDPVPDVYIEASIQGLPSLRFKVK